MFESFAAKTVEALIEGFYPPTFNTLACCSERHVRSISVT